MKTALIFIPILFFTGCLYINDRGISNEYYNDCNEYYDSMGVYHKKCDENIIEFKDVKSGAKKIYNKAEKAISN